MTTVAIGKPLPSLTAESTHGAFDSAALQGKPFVLYFYPKDNTPGCTTESQNFRDLHPQFQSLDCPVFGISRDSIKSHENFTDQQSLPFALVSDPDETLCQLFDVMKQKNMYGKQVRGIERSTFLVDQHGTLVQEWRGVRVPGHADEVLQAVRKLTA
ncbi:MULTISPECIES: peroxiredoxin [unclassified Castellaniella]|jgi:peroxiredoxin Q/BCP|uniref:peroxiredoxin n=1 Tax=unclassified Castellaniella TaxID=2617606 RepID=UPI003314CFD6